VADTSHRALTLLSLLATRRRWSLRELTDKLGASPRTVRRDIDTLRRLDYPVQTVRGPDGGYQLGAGHTLPPLLFDEDQALAVAVALQTAPTTVFGLGADAARALDTLVQVLPVKVRTAMESLRLTRLPNSWDFAAPPISSATLATVGSAVRHRRTLEIDVLRSDLTRPDPRDPDFVAPRRLEPHHLVVWAGRWYVVGYDLGDTTWLVLRVDRLHLHASTGVPFAHRELPGGDVARFVTTSPDRGDIPAAWQCSGRVRMALPADVVARWAPGGAVVEELDDGHSRLTIGAWSWAGIAGLLSTFDADLTEVEPPELVAAFQVLADRWRRAGLGDETTGTAASD
jgi:predicted DNA-binding transcriptional regulator YafY